LGKLPRVIPVLDLLGGQVVRGIAGRREEYRPIESRLCRTSAPVDVAQALAKAFGFREAYVADLDAIAGAEPAWDAYRAIAESGLQLLVDAGLCSNVTLTRFVTCRDEGWLAAAIVGLETLPSIDFLAQCVAELGSERIVFSLDLKEGQPISRLPEWQEADPFAIATQAFEVGVKRMVILDLARVGTSTGVGTEDLARRIRAAKPDVELIGGGGVRGVDDLRALAGAGYDAALVASALHDGRLTREQIR
jgi:phosphoribosylformimino-5-aminoimidazole carboxamide ribotide isomerase